MRSELQEAFSGDERVLALQKTLEQKQQERQKKNKNSMKKNKQVLPLTAKTTLNKKGTCSRFLRNSTGRSWSIISNNRFTGPFSSHLKKIVLVRTTGEFSDRHVSCKCKITFLEKV